MSSEIAKTTEGVKFRKENAPLHKTNPTLITSMNSSGLGSQ